MGACDFRASSGGSSEAIEGEFLPIGFIGKTKEIYFPVGVSVDTDFTGHGRAKNTNLVNLGLLTEIGGSCTIFFPSGGVTQSIRVKVVESVVSGSLRYFYSKLMFLSLRAA